MLDGRHTGTGGGNHIVLGGPTPGRQPGPPPARPAAQPDRLLAQSPVAVVPVLGPVRRPAPARRRGSTRPATTASTSWRSPSARFPTDGGAPPWLVDRVFRHLLVDVTGNTHRAEFCIDKLYTPDSASGRLGLVELRAFEMPPHARMSLVQQLLIRGLVARFWENPVLDAAGPLGHRAARPLHAAALRRPGLPRRAPRAAAGRAIAFQSEWFAPHFEFRFPLIGSDHAATASTWSCARPSSPGTSWARRPPAAARRGTSIRRSSGCR